MDNINQKYLIFRDAKTILDIGSAPGSWLQYIKQNTNFNTRIIGIDTKGIIPIENIVILQGNFAMRKFQNALALNSYYLYDVIVSDMAPNTNGIKAVDHIKIIHLATQVLHFAQQFLTKNGHMTIKLFEGEKNKEFYVKAKRHFKYVYFFKPKASYQNSSEIFLIAKYKI